MSTQKQLQRLLMGL